MKAHLQQTPVAIIGMASIFPQARNLQEYWHNILHKVNCITTSDPAQFDVISYNLDPSVSENTNCQRDGFIPESNLSLSDFRLQLNAPPEAAPAARSCKLNIPDITDVSQLMALIVAKEAMADAGYGESQQFNRERTGVLLGMALARQLTTPDRDKLHYTRRHKVSRSTSLFTQETQTHVEKTSLATVNREENASPARLAKVVSRQIVNCLDLGGEKCVVDAACTSSLGALTIAIKELTEYRRDMMLTGGVDIGNSAFSQVLFSKTSAGFDNQNVRPFDADADGMIFSDGIGMVVLKRLEDAERDRDRIYAVIKGIGISSADRYKSIYAPPRSEGQIGVLQRAYRNAGLSPLSVGLIEAHGTGTKAGDQVEFTALRAVFGKNNSRTQHIALGSVKSQIGNTKAAAGAASLIKTALALHHKVLPPTINITRPHPKLNIETSPFYLNTETSPWIQAQGSPPRRAGVSSFGFGGTSYHIILEEYKSELYKAYPLHSTSQSVLLSASTPT